MKLDSVLSFKTLMEYNHNNNAVIGLTSGCFDIMHYYHLKYLEKCKRLCDILLVGIDSDSFVRKIKGPERPVFNEFHRSSLVDALECVDGTFIMDSIEHFEYIAVAFEPRYIFKNQAFKDKPVAGTEFCKEVIIIDDVDEITSTTDFIKKIRKNTWH